MLGIQAFRFHEEIMINMPPVPRIATVRTQSEANLIIDWQEGGSVRVDLSGWIKLGGNSFAGLRDWGLFCTAEVRDYGLAVGWGDDEDLSIDSFHLALLAEQQRPFGDADISAWQDRLALSNQEAADLLGIGLSTWHTYKSGAAAIPQGVQIACRAVERDRVLLEAHYKPRRPSGRPPKAA